MLKCGHVIIVRELATTIVVFTLRNLTMANLLTVVVATSQSSNNTGGSHQDN